MESEFWLGLRMFSESGAALLLHSISLDARTCFQQGRVGWGGVEHPVDLSDICLGQFCSVAFLLCN